MTTQAHNLAGDPAHRARRAFTFTEILIALALIVVLLIGVSQVFTITGETISRSQAFSNASRTQRAIQQTLANDILGTDPDDDRNGFVPMQVNNPAVPSGSRQPFLIISNFRIPAYLNAQDERDDIDRPAANAPFQARSQAIRSIDISGNGIIDGNENLSIYDLGLRNFRTDTFTFFSRGQFSRQIAEDGTSPSQFSSGEAMIHYGHLRLFNGEQDKRNDADDGYGPPGYLNTLAGTAGRPNRNNVYAEQFALGRMQFLLRDYQFVAAFGERAVVDDSGTAMRHVARQWVNVVDDIAVGTPFDIRNSSVASGTPTSFVNPITDLPTGATQATSVKLMDVRTDVMGINLDTAERRIEAQQRLDPSGAWWADFPGTSYFDRLLAATNPSRPFSAATLAQRHHVLAESSTQFIVEFAGDFFTQDPTTGVITGLVEPGPAGWINAPDGLDFVFDPNTGRRSIRWYGLPRDTNADGVIGGSVQPHEIVDVLPVRDFARRRGSAVNFPFERVLPPYVAGDYASVVNELGASPDQSSYVCVWGPYEMANFNGVLSSPPNPPGIFHTGVPSLVRITVEIRDPNNRLAEPVVQQYIFPLRP